MNTVVIGAKRVGDGEPVFVIAEAGVNHNGDSELAKKLIDAAKDAGADAIKFQTFTPDELAVADVAQAAYQEKNTGTKESQLAMLQGLALTHAEFATLKEYATERGVMFLSTPFSLHDADFLESLHVDAYKIASGDITNTPFLQHVAKKGKPIILSTGMATLEEVRESFEELKKNGASDIIILQCTSEYPTPPSHSNLRVIDTLQKTFDTSIGFSDHTEGPMASVYAVSLGATLIEKHFTLDRTLPGPDHAASLETGELAEMISRIRQTPKGSLQVPEEMLGSGEKIPTNDELETSKLVRKSIVSIAPISKGEQFSTTNISTKRPGTGLAPREFQRVLQMRAARDIPIGHVLTQADV